jgi:formamidopyrimidine-DNA glycosylase
VKDLYIAIKDVIEASISKVEELSKNESISEQSRDFMSVYRKESQSCPRCGNIISQIKVAGRDTFVCSVCQKI